MFDLIDTSNLADQDGPVNVLNASARMLRNDQSVLLTMSKFWSFSAPDVVQYVQKMLCCPPSLIPTIYGLRLLNNFELGHEVFGSLRSTSILFRWKKSPPPFQGVPLALSPALEKSLNQLRTECFALPEPFPSALPKAGMRGNGFYTPLTFCYVLGDLIQ